MVWCVVFFLVGWFYFKKKKVAPGNVLIYSMSARGGDKKAD